MCLTKTFGLSVRSVSQEVSKTLASGGGGGRTLSLSNKGRYGCVASSKSNNTNTSNSMMTTLLVFIFHTCSDQILAIFIN